MVYPVLFFFVNLYHCSTKNTNLNPRTDSSARKAIIIGYYGTKMILITTIPQKNIWAVTI